MNPLNWRMIDKLNLNEMVSTLNPNMLEPYVLDIAFASVTENEIKDSMACKLIHLLQYCVEYFIYIRKMDALELDSLEKDACEILKERQGLEVMVEDLKHQKKLSKVNVYVNN